MQVPLLTPSQLTQFREEGYVILGRILDDAMLEDMRREELRFRQVKLAANPGLINQTIFASQVCHYSEPVRRLGLQGAHLPIVNQLVGPNVALWFTQFVTKNPDAASGKSEFPWHQDNGYVAVDPATNITVWVALDDVDERNGCVWVIPGSHRQGRLDHHKKSEDNWHLAVKVEGEGIPAILKAGEAIAFTGLTLHRSKLNHTDKPRRAFFMEYCQADARYSRDLKDWQPVITSPDAWLVSGSVPIPPNL